MGLTEKDNVEIRFFGALKTLADEKGLPFPCYYEIERECSARDLAEKMGFPTERIEGVFVNGRGNPLEKGWIKPGDRVGFIPYGVPGPYRVLFGFYKKVE